MSTEKNKATHRRMVEEVWNRGNLDAVSEIVAPDAQLHFLPPNMPPGLESLKMFIGSFLAAFPDRHLTIEQQLAEGDKDVLHWRLTGTQTGQLLDIPPTSKAVNITGMEIWRFDENARAVEIHAVFDQLGMLQQLGVIPAPEQGGS